MTSSVTYSLSEEKGGFVVKLNGKPITYCQTEEQASEYAEELRTKLAHTKTPTKKKESA